MSVSGERRLTVGLVLAPREVVGVAAHTPGGRVLRTNCTTAAGVRGTAVSYGDRDVLVSLSCEGTFCTCA